MLLTDPILEFQRARAAAAFQPPVLCSSKAFPLLLAGVPALRKTPAWPLWRTPERSTSPPSPSA